MNPFFVSLETFIVLMVFMYPCLFLLMLTMRKKTGVYIYGKEKRFPLETTINCFIACGLKVDFCPI